MNKLLGFFLLAVVPLAAAEGSGHSIGSVLIMLALIVVGAKFAGRLFERMGQPSVLGELIFGVILGNLSLLGLSVFEPAEANALLLFLAEIGVLILLFQVGLESNLNQMGRVGLRAGTVAVVGVVCPFAAGTFLIGPLLMPEVPFNTHLFVGAALTATSVGITARVFKDLRRLDTTGARTVLGAAVIDDVLGLLILAVVSAIVTKGEVSGAELTAIIFKATGFLVAAIVIGHKAAPKLGAFFSALGNGHGMKMAMALGFMLSFSYLAGLVGLAPIVGAFAAGLVLEHTHFEGFKAPNLVADLRVWLSGRAAANGGIEPILKRHSDRHVEDLFEPVAEFLVPVFFVMTGMAVRMETLFDLHIIGIALAVTVIAILGKLVSGVAALPGDRWLVGVGMVPRGEVGLIFATIGRSLGVVPDSVYSVIVVMVILTTLVTPPVLAAMLRCPTNVTRRKTHPVSDVLDI